MTEAAKKKVLFITPQPYFQWRGSPIRVFFDVRALSELGYDVTLLTMPVGEDKPVPGVIMRRTPNPFRLKNLPIGPSFWKAIYDVIMFFHAAGLVIAHRYDILHGVEDAGVIAGVLGKLSRARIVFEKHSDPSSYRKGGLKNLVLFIYSKMEAFSIHCADAVIGTGMGLVNQARRIAPKKKAYHIFDIPSSLEEADPEKVRKVRSRLQADPGERLVTYVGSFAVYQGIDLMFDAIPHVTRKLNNIRFIIIGGTKEQIAERTSQLAQHDADRAVSFIGNVPPDELPNYLSASDILLSPRCAGTNTPLKILDYMKAGRAIVAADSEANRLILDESRAVMAKPEPEAFAEAIRGLIGDEDARDRLGREGRRKIDEELNFEEFRRLLGVCYDGLGSQGSAAQDG